MVSLTQSLIFALAMIRHAMSAPANERVTTTGDPTLVDAAIYVPPRSSVTAHYSYQCGSDKEVFIQMFHLDAVWQHDHMHWEPKGFIDGFINPGTSEPYEGHVGFYHSSCGNVGQKTKCGLYFSGEFRAEYNPARNVVDVSALRATPIGRTALVAKRACRTVINGPLPQCPNTAGPQNDCTIINVWTTAR